MKIARKALALALMVALLALGAPLASMEPADGAPGPVAVHSAFAAVSQSYVYLVLPGDTGSALYRMPLGGGNLTLIESSAQIEGVISVDQFQYYLSYVDGAFRVMAVTDGGARSLLAQFSTAQVAYSMVYYDGALYCLLGDANGYRLTRVNVLTGAVSTVSDRLMTGFTIAGGYVYYESATDTKEYTKPSLIDSANTITQSAGRLFAMSLDGTRDVELFNQGVSDLRAWGDYVYFHNLNDSYNMNNDAGEEWLEGHLYRMNVQTNQLMLVATTYGESNYDWNYRPTDAGLVSYQSGNILLGEATGANPASLYQPELYTDVAILEDSVITYEYKLQLLTRIPLDGSGAILLSQGSFVVNNATPTPEVTATPAPTPLPTGYTDPSWGDSATPATGTTGTTDTTGTTGTGGSVSAVSATVTYGATGAEVTAMQRKLVSLGYLSKADGVFGAKTLAAVKAFQTAYGLTVDGVAGSATLAKLSAIASAAAGSELRYGSSGSAVLTMQQRLKALGYLSSADGDFGTKTQEAVKAFQSAAGLTADGVAGTKTLTKLYGAGAPKSGSSGSGYIFPNSSKKKLTRSEILAVNSSMWEYGRNEIYARHGYEFTKSKYANYFAAKTWYTPGGFSTTDLSDIEWDNMELIKWMEDNEA